MKRILVNGKKCPVQRKTMFPNEKMAGAAMMRAWGHTTDMDIRDMHTYLCEHCNHWHFGHISYYNKYLEKQANTNVQA